MAKTATLPVKEEKAELNTQLDKILTAFTKKFGDDTIQLGTEIAYRGEVASTGSLILDAALGIGGLPVGRIVEIFGGESSGKTTLALTMAANMQKNKKIVALIDAEGTYDKGWGERLGINHELFIKIEPDSFEDAIDKTVFLLQNGVDLVIFDSVAAAPTTSDVEGDAGDANIGIKARIMSKSLPKIITLIRENKKDGKKPQSVIFINQVREKIGVMYGDPTTTPGGNALKFYASIRLRLSKKSIKEGTDIIGDEINVKIVKNKVAPPHRTAILTLLYDYGFDKNYEIVEIGTKMGFIEKGGSWLTLKFMDKPERIQGSDKCVEYMRENPEVAKKLEELIRSKLNEDNLHTVGIVEGTPEE